MNYYAVMDYSCRLSIEQENLGTHLQSLTTFSPITYLIQFLVVIFLLRSLIIIPNLSLYKGIKLIIKPCRFIAGTTLNFLLVALEKMCPFKTLMWNLMMTNHQFNDFYFKLAGCVERHAPIKKLSPKEVKLKHKMASYCFNNRDYISQCKNSLKMNLRFSEDNVYILKECKKLKYLFIINDFVIKNGFIKVFLHNSNVPIKIAHPDVWQLIRTKIKNTRVFLFFVQISCHITRMA